MTRQESHREQCQIPPTAPAPPVEQGLWDLKPTARRPSLGASLVLICWIAVAGLMSGCNACYQCGPAWALPSIPPLGIFRKPPPQPFFDPQNYSLFVAPDFASIAPQRVLIVPTGTESGRYQIPIHFAEALAGAIRSAGVAEVVFPPQMECLMTVDRLLTGQFDERDIASLSRNWQCDGILFVRVNQLQAYAPLKASVTAALVDARESVVVFAIDGNWDTSDSEIRAGFEHFVKQGSLDVSDSEMRLQRQAPSRLMAYVAYQLTSAWQTAAR